MESNTAAADPVAAPGATPDAGAPDPLEDATGAATQEPTPDAPETPETDATDAPPQGEAPDPLGDEPAEDVDAEPAPEYEALELPEGMVVDDAALGKFAPVAQKLGLDQAGFQELATLYAQLQQQQAQAQQQAATTKGHADYAVLTKDPDLGGANIKRTTANMNRALSTLGSPELKALLRDQGLGRNIHVARFLDKIGGQLGEDNVHDGPKTPPVKPVRLYPNSSGLK